VWSAAIKFSGIPQTPKPPHITVMPSLTTPRNADSASAYTFFEFTVEVTTLVA
jgi:hypothetical protein